MNWPEIVTPTIRNPRCKEDKPWLQTSYGNSIYPGAGGSNLGADMPLSEEGQAAYERWVTALVARYADKVWDWEVWNEPNFGDNKVNTPEITAHFNIRTATIIKAIQPDARISALAMGHLSSEQWLQLVEMAETFSTHFISGLTHLMQAAERD